MSAPQYAHRLLDLAWESPGGLDEYRISRHATPGRTYSAKRKYSDASFTVNIVRDYETDEDTEEWSVTLVQPQPEPVPTKKLTLEEYGAWDEERWRRYEEKYGPRLESK